MARLVILEEVVAGGVPSRRVERGTTTRLMTGAPVPDGADCVVMIEHAEIVAGGAAENGTVLLSDGRVVAGQNIMRRAASVRKGEIVLRTGAIIRPIEIGLLAEVGRATVSVVRRPTVAILLDGQRAGAARANARPWPDSQFQRTDARGGRAARRGRAARIADYAR